MNRLFSKARSTIGLFVREVALYPSIVKAKSDRSVAFLPSSGREQSGLLRAYLIADHLGTAGWNTLVVPKHLNARQRNRVLNAFQPDLIVLQTCRHSLNRMEFLEDRSIVLDQDDADFLDTRLTEIMDNVARNARGIICGSRYIQNWASRHNDNTVVVWTGSPLVGGSWPHHLERRRIVTWAQAEPLALEEELTFIEEVVLRAQKQTRPFVFRLYGWKWPENHPRLQRLRNAGVELELIAPMPYEKFLLSLRDVAVGVSAIVEEGFSRGKSFGKILGYLDSKTPVICSDRADHAVFFAPESGIVSNDPDVWVREMVALLDDPLRRQRMSDLSYQQYYQDLSIEAAGEKVRCFLDSILRERF